MTIPVIFSAVADKQVDEIDGWWRANRSAAPGLFTQELDVALQKLAETPFVGIRYARRRSRTVRRILLSRTRHHVFYIPESGQRRGFRVFCELPARLGDGVLAW